MLFTNVYHAVFALKDGEMRYNVSLSGIDHISENFAARLFWLSLIDNHFAVMRMRGDHISHIFIIYLIFLFLRDVVLYDLSDASPLRG